MGPRTDPWGTPVVVLSQDEATFLITTLFSVFQVTPYSLNNFHIYSTYLINASEIFMLGDPREIRDTPRYIRIKLRQPVKIVNRTFKLRKTKRDKRRLWFEFYLLILTFLEY